MYYYKAQYKYTQSCEMAAGSFRLSLSFSIAFQCNGIAMAIKLISRGQDMILEPNKTPCK